MSMSIYKYACIHQVVIHLNLYNKVGFKLPYQTLYFIVLNMTLPIIIRLFRMSGLRERSRSRNCLLLGDSTESRTSGIA